MNFSSYDLLSSNPVVASLTVAERQALQRASFLHKADKHDSLVIEGDESEQVFFLLEGTVRVFHVSTTGPEVTVKIFKAPSVFGEMECICNIPFLENVTVLEPSRLMFVPRPVFLELLRDHPAVTLALLQDVCARFCIASHNEKSLAFNDVRTRLATFLLQYADFDGVRTPRGTRLRLKLTQEDLAAVLGVTRRAVANEFLRWQREQVLEKIGGYYLIRDAARLSQEALPYHLSITYDSRQGLGFKERDPAVALMGAASPGAAPPGAAPGGKGPRAHAGEARGGGGRPYLVKSA